MDIELAVDLIEMTPNIDHAVLFSGDGDFRRVVETVQRRGVQVTVVSTIHSNPPMIADELRRQADNFIDLKSIRGEISRQESEKNTHQHPEIAKNYPVTYFDENFKDPDIEIA